MFWQRLSVSFKKILQQSILLSLFACLFVWLVSILLQNYCIDRYEIFREYQNT